jgi:ATP-dependent DNA helicase DinG
MDLPWPLFTLGRNGLHTMEQFKESSGSVLLAAGAAWEGFDFPGDCVSLLIIPRLPFPCPDAIKEKEREKYPTLRAYLRAVAVPEMQIKLRQGFGRAIRTETDTCVVAILDPRAAKGQRYFADVLTALPKMPVTSSLRGVETTAF